MSSNPVTTSGDSSTQATKERLQRLEQDLIRQRKSIDGSTTLTTIVGLIVLAAIAGFYYYGYQEISIVKDPNRIVDYGQTILDDNIGPLRARLESEIVQSAPQWAETLSKEALGSLPVARRRLEMMAKEYTEQALAETRKVTAEKFQEYFASHHKELEKAFEELAKSPNLAENTLQDLERGLNKDLEVDLKADAASLLKEVTQRNQNFKNLKEGKGLSQEAQIERRAWMLARALQRESLDLGTTGLPNISANGQSSRNPGKGSTGSTGPKTPPDSVQPVPKKDKASDGGKKTDAPKADTKKDKPSDSDKKKDDSKANK
jgi:hypothetical protein